MNNATKLLDTWNTVFSIADIKKIFGKTNSAYVNLLLQSLKKQWILQNIYYGIWVFQKYDLLELASKLVKSSYISFETVLQKHNVIFQHYQKTITLASTNTLQKQVDWYIFAYHKIRDSILMNPIGIQNTGKYMIASAERAICDMIYLYKNIHFDNIGSLDLMRLEEIAHIYPKTTFLAIQKLIDNAQSR